MARISGVNIPSDKKVLFSLTYIYGIGRPTAAEICKAANVSPDTRTHKLTEDEIIRLSNVIEKSYKVEGDLRKEVAMNIKKMIDMGSYKGLRHRNKLPVRGQRTHTNARTRKGKGQAIAGKKKPAK